MCVGSIHGGKEAFREEEGNTCILLRGLSVSGGMSLSCKYSQVTSDQLKGMDKLNKTKYFVYIISGAIS